MKFLIVVDNDIFRAYLREFIISATDEFIELDNGTCLNWVYNLYNPDWVLIDTMIKNPNGFKLAENLKSECPSARLVLLSDYSDRMYVTEAAKTGASAIISKENLYELLELIDGEKI